MGTKSKTASRPIKQAKGGKNQMKKLNELKKVTSEIDERFKVSEKLFIKKDKLKKELGIL